MNLLARKAKGLTPPALSLSFLVLTLAAPAIAQEGGFHADCGAGRLYDFESGSCRPAEDLLAQDGDLFWVDQQRGSDTNPGTEDRPWRTITRANRAGQLTPGDAVLIRAGTYREGIRPRAGGTSGALITFAAYPGEAVTVSGADVVNRPGAGYDGWGRQGDGSWRHAWSWAELPATGSYDADYRRELFVVNGVMLRQRSGQSRPSLRPGEFWVEGPDDAPRAVFLRAPDDGDPNERTVEVGQRSWLFQPESRDVCANAVDGYYRLILLRFTHSTAQRQRMAVCTGDVGSRIEEIEAVWNNAGGIQVVGEDHLVRGAVANHNGVEGIGGTGCDGCVVEHSEVSYNHWKWWQEDGYRVHGGGGKFTRMTNSTLRYNTYIRNQGNGIWFDLDVDDNDIYGNYFDENLKQGIMIEMGSDGNRVYNNVVARSHYYSSIWNGIGISVSTSDDNLVAYNTLILNEGSGVRVGGDDREDALRTVIYNNLFVDNARAALDPLIDDPAAREIMIVGGGGDGLSDWERIRSQRINGNAYWYRDPDDVSAEYATFMASPSNADEDRLYANALEEWQEVDDFDRSGMVTDLDLPSVVNPSDPEEGWRLSPESQYMERAIALPSGFDPILTDFFGNARPASGGAVGAHQPGGEPPPPPPPPPPPGGLEFGEGGTVTVNQNGAGEWHAVTFGRTYDDPVVVMGPSSSNDGEPVTLRVRNVRGTGFEFQLDEWDYLDGAHGVETVSYLVVEAGRHVLPSGARLQAGRLTSVDHRWKQAHFATSFESPPVVLAQAMTFHGHSAVAPRLRSVTSSGFQVKLQEEEGNDGNHSSEVVGYVAIALTSDAADGVLVGRTGDSVDHRAATINFAASFPEAPAFLAAIQTFDGGSPAALRYQSITDSDVEVFVQEEESENAGGWHTKEVVGYVAIPASLTGTAGPEGAASVVAGTAADALPESYGLAGAYPNPTEDRATLRYTLPATADARIEVFDALGRRVAVLAEGAHPAGWHEVTFDGTSLPSGVYLVRLQAGPHDDVLRLTLVR